MSRSYPIMSSFSGGEMSPLLLARNDVDAYRNSTRTMRNMIATSHGPAEKRNGSEYLDRFDGTSGRVFGFQHNKGTAFFVTATDESKLYITDTDGVSIDLTKQRVANGDFNDGSTSWTDASSTPARVDFLLGECKLIPGSTTDAVLQQNNFYTTPGADTYWLFIVIEDASPDNPVSLALGTSAGDDSLYSGNLVQRKTLVSCSVGGSVALYVQLTNAAGQDTVKVSTVYVYSDTDSADLSFTTPWTAEDLQFIQAAMPPGGDALYFVSPKQAPQKLSFNATTRAWTFAAVSFTSPPAEWGSNNYPSAITFFQGRMWVGGTPDEPETFWASKSGTIENFTQGALADDGLEFTISEQGAIRWLAGAKNLVIGTESGEHIVESSSGVITPDDVQVIQQSSYGSAYMQALRIGQMVLYVSPDGRKLREIGYQWTDDGWISRDVTFTSEHITKNNAIVDVCFAQNPRNLVWAVTENGTLLGCTYERTYKVTGWHRHDTEGAINSIDTVTIDGTSYVGALVERAPLPGASSAELHLEVITLDEVYMDSFVVLNFEAPVVSVSGLDHLAGYTVSVLTDGGVHPETSVNSSGVLYLQWEASTVAVGIGYTAEMETLPVAVMGDEGSTHSFRKRWSRVYLRLLSSALPKINGVRPADRHPATPMGTPSPLITDDVHVSTLGWDNWATITVEQELPLPCVVAGVFGEMSRETL